MGKRDTRGGGGAAKQQQNLLALLVVVLVLGAGGWLVDRLLENRRIQNCIEARHRNCVPLDLPERNPRPGL